MHVYDKLYLFFIIFFSTGAIAPISIQRESRFTKKKKKSRNEVDIYIYYVLARCTTILSHNCTYLLWQFLLIISFWRSGIKIFVCTANL